MDIFYGMFNLNLYEIFNLSLNSIVVNMIIEEKIDQTSGLCGY